MEDFKKKMTTTKKQRRLKRELQLKMLKRDALEAKKKFNDKVKQDKKKMRLMLVNKRAKKTSKPSPNVPLLVAPGNDTSDDDDGSSGPPAFASGYDSSDDEDESSEPKDMRSQLLAQQKPGVSFPHDSCSSKKLTPEFEATALTQYNLKRGLKEFCADGFTALGNEMEQLHVRKVAKPVDSTKLTQSEKQASLRYLMFLTKKRWGRIKARGCADGRKQRQTTSKEDASAPTVAIESVLLSATIDALEERDVATLDIPGAFMQADIDEVVHVKFEGEIAEMLLKMDPKLYRKYVKIKKENWSYMLSYWRLYTEQWRLHSYSGGYCPAS